MNLDCFTMNVTMEIVNFSDEVNGFKYGCTRKLIISMNAIKAECQKC